MLPKVKKAYRRSVYLDHAAATPVDERVVRAMAPFWSERFGNPSSLYAKGREANHALEAARAVIAGLLGARPDEVTFTAGGTESINAAIFGVARGLKPTETFRPHLIASAIEHHAVLHSLEALEREGYAVTLLDVDGEGFIRLKEMARAIRPETILVSLMYANNEIGTVEPVAEVGKWLKGLNAERVKSGLPRVLLHTDACQAAGSLDIDVQRLGVDLLSANGSKMYGPKQTGFLYIRSGIKLKPLIYGGGQERNLRSGTENVPGAVGLAEAFRLAQGMRLKENARLRRLRDYFIDQLFKKIPKVVLNGPDERGSRVTDRSVRRLPNSVNLSILDIEGEALLLYLDAYGICMSTGSACTSTSLDPSHVILAIGRPYEYAHGSMRFTLGRDTTKRDINYVMQILPDVVSELRRISPVVLDPSRPQQVSVERAFVGQNMAKFRNKKLT